MCKILIDNILILKKETIFEKYLYFAAFSCFKEWFAKNSYNSLKIVYINTKKVLK